MQQKLLLSILCSLFSVPFAYAADAAQSGVAATGSAGAPAQKTADPKPVKLDTANTLFRIRIVKKVAGQSPNFRKHPAQEPDQDIQANPGTTFDVISKQVDTVTVVNKSTDPVPDPAPYYVVVPVDFDRNLPAALPDSKILTDQAYRVKTKEIDEGYGVVRESLVSGMFIAPFKYYPHTHSFATTSLTIAPYLGYETNDSPLTYWCRKLSKTDCPLMDFNWLQKYTYFVSLGPSFVSVTDQNNKSSQVFALSAALGVAYDIKGQVKFVMATGKDWTGSTATPYKYNAFPWFAVTLGYSF
jgi:hypothetical protein